MRFPKRIAEMVFLVSSPLQKINEALSLCLDPAGNQRPQVWRVLARVHAVGQPEEAHAHPQQRQALPVSRVLQELHPEADPQDAHDCPPARQALQVQGAFAPHPTPPHPATSSTRHKNALMFLTPPLLRPFPASPRCAASLSTECTTCWATCISTLAASPSSVLTAPVSSTWRGTSADTWRSSTGWTSLRRDKVSGIYLIPCGFVWCFQWESAMTKVWKKKKKI